MILEHKGINVFYTDQGKGAAVILLHGFLEDSSMWNNITPELTKTNRVICIDLLGQGKTGSIGYTHTMQAMAEAVFAVLKQLKLRKYILVGHSMGGYVALAFAKLHPEKTKGLVLLNSTYKADTTQRKTLRERANKMAQTNFINIIRMSFANLFTEDSKLKHAEQYNIALETALQTTLQGYMAAQEGMKDREDASTFIAEAPFKSLILLGKKDTLLNPEKIVIFANKHGIETAILPGGHMSHIENTTACTTQIKRFLKANA